MSELNKRINRAGKNSGKGNLPYLGKSHAGILERMIAEDNSIEQSTAEAVLEECFHLLQNSNPVNHIPIRMLQLLNDNNN